MKPFITSIGTQAAPFKVAQSQICKFMARSLGLNETEKRDLELLYRASGIRYRYSIIPDYAQEPKDFSYYPANERLEPFPQTQSRMKLYGRHATEVMSQAARKCLNKRPQVTPESVTHLITVSCTGMFAPGPDIQLVGELGLKQSVKRTAINFMGCYAAFNAMKTARAFCATDPKARVLVVCAEFCSIHFQKKTTPDHLLSGALFGDGAAALLMENEPGDKASLQVMSEYCDLFPEGDQEMAWDIGDFGFEMKLSAYIPDLIQKGIGSLARGLLSGHEVAVKDIEHFAVHPGGKKILEVVEKELDISRGQNRESHEVLRDYGNMSSPTILFVLEKIMEKLTAGHKSERVLAFAFGPGLTLESLLFKIHA